MCQRRLRRCGHVSRSELSAKLLNRRDGSEFPSPIEQGLNEVGECVVQFEDAFESELFARKEKS
jgi:hypothetical protein